MDGPAFPPLLGVLSTRKLFKKYNRNVLYFCKLRNSKPGTDDKQEGIGREGEMGCSIIRKATPRESKFISREGWPKKEREASDSRGNAEVDWKPSGAC